MSRSTKIRLVRYGYVKRWGLDWQSDLHLNIHIVPYNMQCNAMKYKTTVFSIDLIPRFKGTGTANQTNSSHLKHGRIHYKRTAQTRTLQNNTIHKGCITRGPRSGSGPESVLDLTGTPNRLRNTIGPKILLNDSDFMNEFKVNRIFNNFATQDTPKQLWRPKYQTTSNKEAC